MKTTRIFHLRVFIFLEVKFSIYFNRPVFVMKILVVVVSGRSRGVQGLCSVLWGGGMRSGKGRFN